MKNRVAALLLAAGILLGLLAAMPEPAGAAGPAQLETYVTPFTDTENALSGVSTYRQQFFEIPDTWSIKNVKVHLDYKASQLLLNERSSITFLMNGSRFYSFRPELSDLTRQQLTVNVPGSLLVKGTNTLVVEGYIQTDDTDSFCPPTQTREHWLQLFDTSHVSVDYTVKPMSASISDFHKFYAGLDAMNNGRAAVAVPPKAEPEEMEAAVYALSGFAQSNPLKEKLIPLLEYGSAELQKHSMQVVVGRTSRLAPGLRDQLDLNGRDPMKEALLQVVILPDRPTLVITSENADLLRKAGRLAANPALMQQIKAAVKIVDERTNVDTPAYGISRDIQLTGTGDKLTGPQHREKQYYIALPANRSIAEASKIRLNFRYARNLDFDRSLVTILVNGTPIGSKKLTPQLADGDTLSLPIPKNLNISGNFTVTAAFDLEIKELYCTDNQNQMPWAYVTKDSMLQLNTKDRTELLFNNYPYPFLRDGSYNQVAVVLPQQRNGETYLALTNIFNLLGQYAVGNTGEVTFVSDTAGENELKSKQIIAIGSYQDNRLIQHTNDKLYFRYDEKGEGFVSNEKMSIDTDYGRQIGSLQLLPSPYEAGHALLAVTGASPEAYNLASKLVSNQGTLYKIYGDGAVTDLDGNVYPYRFKKQAEAPSSTAIADVLQRKDVVQFLVSLVLVLVLVLVSLMLLFIKYKKRRTGEDRI
ncbi:cellulose biosynthesis cyclic di-GMP-binding regulatory protein BcsB [Paenibacillus gansuensis]|uniref:Cellulose biosynthesis cyclic di-GMP-binding regulatory protein BcsB n=1 Tax=Paenibacillus gansuensis TaxID=306542 RepID=A0ABW5PGK5_9BACL